MKCTYIGVDYLVQQKQPVALCVRYLGRCLVCYPHIIDSVASCAAVWACIPPEHDEQGASQRISMPGHESQQTVTVSTHTGQNIENRKHLGGWILICQEDTLLLQLLQCQPCCIFFRHRLWCLRCGAKTKTGLVQWDDSCKKGKRPSIGWAELLGWGCVVVAVMTCRVRDGK